jgi:hypothetical protein
MTVKGPLTVLKMQVRRIPLSPQINNDGDPLEKG